MHETVLDRLAAIRVVPVVVIDDPGHADSLGAALVSGGLPCAEVTLRTRAGEAALRTMAARGDMLVGAGTVLTAEQVDRAVDAGADFIVSPGFALEVVTRAQKLGVAVVPGVATASEVQSAVVAGLDAMKFFPAAQAGGLSMLSALAGPFPAVRFLPSGGVNLGNVLAYLAHPSVFAVGGSWMVPRERIVAADFEAIEALSRATMAHLAEVEPG
jgi:2-dehydro-3-deoxyphosphogluconate aldolase/(4S)-4-hydroxy-2-oxoglutarate aldolase